MRFTPAVSVLLFATAASAQVPAKDVTLTVMEDEAKLIVQMLDAIQCANVAQLGVCIKAMELKARVQKQVIQQDK